MSNLEDVKVEDLLISHSRVGKRIVRVAKITPTQIVTTLGERYRKKDGYEIGCGNFYYNYLTIPKEGEVESIRRNSLVIDVCIKGKKMLDSYNISYEQAIKIKKILNV